MKISYKHLISRIDEKPNIEELSNKLFQLGHEHEINGNVFDMELTPNRGDCLSVNGLLRDLSLFYSINNNLEIYKKELNEFNFNFVNHAKKDCPKISFLKIEIDSIPEKYNQEMESYFYDLNVKKNNFFTDISNYISYETGQPTHCYDMSEISEGVTLDYLKTKQNFNTLLDNKIELKAGDLAFINNKNEVINLAGIMGGSSTSSESTSFSQREPWGPAQPYLKEGMAEARRPLIALAYASSFVARGNLAVVGTKNFSFCLEKIHIVFRLQKCFHLF